MITKKLIINGTEYSVSSTTVRGLEEAEQYLKQSLKNYEDFVDREADVQPEPQPEKPKRATRKKS